MMEKHFCLDDSPTFRMIELDEVDSTNNFLRHLDTPGDCRTTLVTAEYQSSGRGADTNRWESARGENLLFSLRVMPRNLSADKMFAISEATALALKEALDAFLAPSNPSHPYPADGFGDGSSLSAKVRKDCSQETFSIKWPNDIYFGDSKVAGILIENDLLGTAVRRSTIGIGINVNQRRFVSDAPNPRSLADIVGHDVERRFVLEGFMGNFMHRLKQVDDEHFNILHEDYKRHLYRLQENHKYADEMGDFCAMLVDVEQSGHLILRDDLGRLRRYAFKEVRYILE